MSPRNAKLVKWLTAAAVVVSLLTCLAPAISTSLNRVWGHFAEIRWTWLAVAFLLCLIYWPANAYVWNMVLAALGHPLHGPTAVRVWFTTQTCRWLPGGIWHYGSRTMQAVAHGVPSTTAVASIALELLLTVIAWALLAAIGILVYGSQLQLGSLDTEKTMAAVAVSLLALLLMAAAVWIAWRYFPQRFEALRTRFAALRLVRPRCGPALNCLLVYVLLSLLNGLAFYAVVRGVAPQTEVPLLAAISANALAWLVGLFAVLAPGGLVVRETALALQMGLWMPPTVAILVAVLWRLVQLAVEFVVVLIAIAPTSIPWRAAKPAVSLEQPTK